MKTLQITEAQLEAALQEWISRDRDGKCLSEPECRSMSIEELARGSTRFLWDLLARQSPSPDASIVGSKA